MNQALSKADNKLVLKRRRRKKIKKLFMLFIMLVSICITLCLKLPYFFIRDIKINGNNYISAKNIVTLSNIKEGNNIFYINLKEAKNNILSNPYISNVSITRKLPSTIVISVKERDAIFYNNIDNIFYILDKDGIVLQKRDNISGLKLVKLDGIDYSKCEVGKPIQDSDKRKLDAVVALGDIMKNNKVSQGISLVDVNNSVDIKVYYGEICIKLGNADDMEKKFNKALNILDRQELKGVKGYIDVSFNGNPVFFIQK